MYNLILVDDEEEVRKGVLNKIDWNMIGFRVLGEAANGLEALEIAEKNTPDVLITDIRMPFMDGLTLTKKMREKYPTLKIVILTGFDEFEYAQKAIKLDVVEYILKPISSKELIDVLLNIKQKLDEEIAEKKDMDILREHYKRSIPILKEKFLCSLVTNKLDRDEIVEKAYTYDIKLSEIGYIVSIVSIDFNSAALYLSDDKELVKFAVLNLCEEIMDKYGYEIIFINEDYIVIIFNSEYEDRESTMKGVLMVLEQIRLNIKKYYKFAVTIGVGTYCSDVKLIARSYEKAISALDYRLLFSSDRVICIDDLEPVNTDRIVFDESKERMLISCIKVGTEEEVYDTIDELFNEIIDAKISFKDYQIYLFEILTTILTVAKDLDVDMDKIFGTDYNLFGEAYRIKDLNGVKEWIASICIRIKSYIYKERKDTCKLLVKRATDYIESSYNESDITIDKVCKMLHISSSYFSTIFKRETKSTFNNYLTNIRMDAAKELLRTTNLKNYEIAYKVGYPEPNYFSYCFKKNFGLSPSEYRNM